MENKTLKYDLHQTGQLLNMFKKLFGKAILALAIFTGAVACAPIGSGHYHTDAPIYVNGKPWYPPFW
jgi:hypothetical protein